MTKEQRKAKAVELLKQLNVYKPYVKGFENEDRVCFFERYAGFWVDQEPEVFEKMQEIEKNHNCTVYAITHEFTDFGECYSFLLVTDYEEEWDNLVYQNGNRYSAFSYVWNKSDEWCSEFGSVGVASNFGGITRFA